MKGKHLSPKRLAIVIVALAVAGFVVVRLAWPGPPDEVYHGKRVSEWVELALVGWGQKPDATRTVIEIGPPAVPFLIKALDDGGHHFIGKNLKRLRQHLPRRFRAEWWEVDACGGRHYEAACLLGSMGAKAAAAVPALIHCYEQCPGLHYVHSHEILTTLDQMGPAASNALPFLTRLAAGPGHSDRLYAANCVYDISNNTNLLVETFVSVARQDPEEFLSSRELFWYRGDRELGRQLVPILVRFAGDPKLGKTERASAILDLKSFGPNAITAMPALTRLFFTTDSPEMRGDILSATTRILGVLSEEQCEAIWKIADKFNSGQELAADPGH